MEVPVFEHKQPIFPACAVLCLVAQCIRLFATPWILAHKAPLSMKFSRQEYWSGFPCPPLADLPNPEIKVSYISELAGRFLTIIATWEALCIYVIVQNLSCFKLFHHYVFPSLKMESLY